MIVVHPSHGGEVFLNADLIESIEDRPDTVITLVDGRRIVVQDEPEEVAGRIIRYRASILATADQIRAGSRSSLMMIEGEET